MYFYEKFHLYILRRFRKLVIVFLTSKNAPNYFLKYLNEVQYLFLFLGKKERYAYESPISLGQKRKKERHKAG